MTMTATKRRMSRLQLVLLVAAALGSSSATMSGVLATLAVQQNGGQAFIA